MWHNLPRRTHLLVGLFGHGQLLNRSSSQHQTSFGFWYLHVSANLSVETLNMDALQFHHWLNQSNDVDSSCLLLQSSLILGSSSVTSWIWWKYTKRCCQQHTAFQHISMTYHPIKNQRKASWSTEPRAARFHKRSVSQWDPARNRGCSGDKIVAADSNQKKWRME